MIKFVAIFVFALATALPAQARMVGPLQEPERIVTPVAAACGAGMTRRNGVCVARTNVRQARRCVRWNGSTCAAWE